MVLPFVRELTQGNKPSLATDAARQQAETNDWQIVEIQAAIAEADAGDFASDGDVKAVMNKWNVDAD
jgi:RHH-type rel operon transcriptional repressor/antitoxin RelB